MYAKRNYGFWMTVKWSIKPFIAGLMYSLVIVAIGYFSPVKAVIPWQPIGVIGIAVAFYLGFKNNSSYDRTWEARKIWGSMVNNSRTFGAAVVAFIQGENDSEIKRELIYRHVAWLTALQFQLRLSQPWEHINERLNEKFISTVCSAYLNRLDQELAKYISNDEIEELENKTNRASQILKRQSARLQQLRNEGYFEDFRHMEFHHLIATFYEDQGKSERIKNFPFPRQYASTALWLTYVFAALVPLGMGDMFSGSTPWVIWVSPFMSALVIWIFFLMEKIGDYSENPFEGTFNDVPISSIARSIEIDLRQMIDDENIPGPIQEHNGFLL